MRVLFFIMCLLLTLPGFTQERISKYDRIGLFAGSQQTHILDQQFSPLLYKAGEVSLGLYYEAEHHKSNWNVIMEAASGSLYPPQYADRQLYNTTEDIDGHITTDSFFVQGTTRTFNLRLGYSFDIIHTSDWELNIGGAGRNQLMYPESFVNIGIMNSASFLVTAEGKYRPNNRHQLSAGIQVPVMSFNSRFPYSGTVSTPNQELLQAFFDGGTHFVSFNKYTQVITNLKWRYALSQHTGIGIQYDFMWQRYTIPVTLKQYSTRLGVAFDISF